MHTAFKVPNLLIPSGGCLAKLNACQRFPLYYMLSIVVLINVVHYSYACSWRRLSPSTDGMSGEAKDLWLFFFTDHLPDITEKLAEGLQGRSKLKYTVHV